MKRHCSIPKATRRANAQPGAKLQKELFGGGVDSKVWTKLKSRDPVHANTLDGTQGIWDPGFGETTRVFR